MIIPLPFHGYKKLIAVCNFLTVLTSIVGIFENFLYDRFASPLLHLAIKSGNIIVSGLIFGDFMRIQRWHNLSVKYSLLNKEDEHQLIQSIRREFLGDFSLFISIRFFSIANFLAKVFEYDRYAYSLLEPKILLYILIVYVIISMIIIIIAVIILGSTLKKYPTISEFDKKPSLASYLALAGIIVAGGEDFINNIVLFLWITALITNSKIKAKRSSIFAKKSKNRFFTHIKKIFSLKQTIEKNYFEKMNSATNFYEVLLISLPAFFFGPVFILFFNDALNYWVNIGIILSLFLIYLLKSEKFSKKKSWKVIVMVLIFLIITSLHFLIFYYENELDPSLLYNNFENSGVIAIFISGFLFFLIFFYNIFANNVNNDSDYVKFLIKFGDFISFISGVILFTAGYFYHYVMNISIIISMSLAFLVWLLIEEASSKYYINLAMDFFKSKNLSPIQILKRGYCRISILSFRVKGTWKKEQELEKQGEQKEQKENLIDPASNCGNNIH